MLFDTDILIWFFRGNVRAARAIEASAERTLSVVSYMEVLRGARDRREAHLIRSVLSDSEFLIAPLTENIGHRAAVYVEEYGFRAALEVTDALIAATAVERAQTLCTANKKHYALIADLEMELFRP